MKIKHALIVLLLFAYSVSFGQHSKNTSAQVDANQREQISQLCSENDDLKKQLDFMEKKIEHEEKVVEDLKGNITFWFSFVSILVTAITMIVAIIGIALPLYNMSEIKEKQKKVEDDLKSAKEQADLATQAASGAKVSSEQVQTQTESVRVLAEQAKQAADDAQVYVFFAQALNEKEPSEAIKYYDMIIERYPKFRKTFLIYINRGNKKKSMGDNKGAMSDYDKAISIKPNYALAYICRGFLKMSMGDDDGAISDYNESISINPNLVDTYSYRAECYRKLAETEQDPTKQADYIAKAEADEKKAEELSQKGKS